MNTIVTIALGVLAVLIVGGFVFICVNVFLTPGKRLDEEAESDMPHTKFEKVLEDFSAQHAGTVIGYYLPEENTVELQCDGEYGFEALGEEIPCVKSASSSEEAKKIFDFFILAMETLDGRYDPEVQDIYDEDEKALRIDRETCSISHVYGVEIVIDGVVEQEAETTCQWFAVEGVLKLHCKDEDQEDRTESCDTWDDADVMIDAYRWETGHFFEQGTEGPTQQGALTKLIDITWPLEQSHGSIFFEATHPDRRTPYTGVHETTGVYSPDKGVITCRRKGHADSSEGPTPVKNKMEAILTFYRYAFPGG